MTPPVVLIVDDNELNRKLARDVLRAAGLDTLEAASGEEAIGLAREQLPDLVLMDLRLPDLDGTEALRRLRAEPATAHIPVVALTALSGARDGAPRGGLRRLPREADRRRRVPGTGAELHRTAPGGWHP